MHSIDSNCRCLSSSGAGNDGVAPGGSLLADLSTPGQG